MTDVTKDATEEKLVLTTSRHFPRWLAGTGCSLAFTTYQAGKVFFIGLGPDGRLSIFERTFARSMGLGVGNGGRSVLLASEFELYRFDNVLPEGAADPDGYDALFAPHQSWITGDCDIHDIAFDNHGQPIFVNTLFSCLATVSEGHSFRPVWTPPFISKLAPEDRCHLNGMAVEAGVARYVTAVSKSDVADGWRDKRGDGGVVIDVQSNEIVCSGLSMPHSPRMHEGRLWIVNSGTGEFGSVDTEKGAFEPLAFCPGYARGMAFLGDHAVIGLSLARNRTFEGLSLDAALAERDTEARCGLVFVNLKTGDMSGWIRIEGVISELYDVAVLPGVARPKALGFKTDEIKRVIAIDEGSD